MENHEEDDLEELRSTVYTFPQNVQNVIEQVRFLGNLLSNLSPTCAEVAMSSVIDILRRSFLFLANYKMSTWQSNSSI